MIKTKQKTKETTVELLKKYYQMIFKKRNFNF